MDWKKFLLHKKTIWIGLGVFALILRLSLSPQFIENWYSRGLFLGVRRIVDLVTGIFPVAERDDFVDLEITPDWSGKFPAFSVLGNDGTLGFYEQSFSKNELKAVLNSYF